MLPPSVLDPTDQAQVLVGGRRCPVVGAISMDMIMVDVTSVPEARIGDADELYDQTAFDEAYDTASLDFFEPMVRRVFAAPRG